MRTSPVLVHQLADQLELEAGLAEGVDPAVRLAQDPGGFERVVDVVLRVHGHGSVTRIGRNAKKRADTTGESALFTKRPPTGSALLAGDVGDDVTDGLELFGFFVGHFDVEFLFEGHDEFDGVERVGTEVFDEFGFRGHLIGVDAKLVDDDVLYTGFDAFI